jgi:SAM-dependent methyltransferase
MPDVWAIVTELDDSMQERLAGVLETRGADAQQRAMRRGFLADLDLPPQSRVLEVGCGTGVLTRLIARLPVAAVVGVDVAPSLLARARDLASGLANVTFEQADGRALPFGDVSFDAVVFDSTLSHLPGLEGGSARRSACYTRVAGSASSTATTRRQQLPSAPTIPCRPVWTRCSPARYTTDGS